MEVGVKEYTWFTLLIRAIGVLVAALCVEPCIAWTAYFLGSVVRGDGSIGTSTGALISRIGSAVAPFAQLAVGLYLIFGGRWLIVRCIGALYGRCPVCGYDVSHLSAGPCPECGVPLPPVLPHVRKETVETAVAPQD
jgi:hypothetical protein